MLYNKYLFIISVFLKLKLITNKIIIINCKIFLILIFSLKLNLIISKYKKFIKKKIFFSLTEKKKSLLIIN